MRTLLLFLSLVTGEPCDASEITDRRETAIVSG